MAKNIQKVNSLEELNGFLGNGRVVYSIANCGSIWFVEYDDSDMKQKNIETLEDIIEKGKRLGYFHKWYDELRIYDVIPFAKLFLGCDEITREQAMEYIVSNQLPGRSKTRYEIKEALGLDK